LNNQVEFGEHVGIIGSTKELGLWEKPVEFDWTPDGWICELELHGGASIEYKFVIFRKGEKEKKWEHGRNRALNLPGEGSFNMVCHWNKTGESPDLVPFGTEQVGIVAVKMEGEDDRNAAESVAAMEEKNEAIDLTKFGEEWKGQQASFMQSNEHRNREVGRIWNLEGLEGVALELVKGDKDSRNWWRKVCLNLNEH
jgi:phosphoglucan, water dikinase